MNLFAFPFYDAKNKQARFNSACTGGSDFVLYSPFNRFLPFQITKPADGQLIDCFKVFDLADNLIYKIEPEDVNYQMYTNGVSDFVFYYGGIIQNMSLPLCAQYYLQIGSYFSEVFTTADVSDLLTLEWHHVANVGPAIYQSGFWQRLYLDAVISDPTYPTKQEEEENGYGESITTLTSVAKRFVFETQLLPEYLVDVLANLPLHSNVKFGQYENVKTIQVEPNWLVSGCAANVEVQFNEAELIISKTCVETLPLNEVSQAGYRPKGWLCGDNSDTAPYWQDNGETRCVKVEAPVNETAWRGIDPYCLT